MSQIAPMKGFTRDKNGENPLPLAPWWAGGVAIPQRYGQPMENTSKVLTMGDQIVEVHRVVPPTLVGGMGERERVGQHGVVWHGKSSEDAVDRGDRVESGVLGLDVTKFTINVHKHAFAELGIFSMPYPEVWQDSRYDKLFFGHRVRGCVESHCTSLS